MLMKNTGFPKKILTTALIGGLALSQLTPFSVTARATDAATPSQTEYIPNTITRVDETGEEGLVRSHFEDSEGKIYTDPGAGQPAQSSRQNKREASVPARYDLREHNLTTSIKDQGVTGCCWAFSAIKAIESNCIKNGLFPADSVDFSENHLAWFSYHMDDSTSDPTYGDGIYYAHAENTSPYSPDPFAYGAVSGTTPYDTGGSAILANFTLAKWAGVDLESNTPFTANTMPEAQSMAAVMEKKSDARYSSYAHLQNVINFDEYTIGEQYYYKDIGMIAKMKQAIMEYGAMSVSLFFDKMFFQTTENGTSYYQNYYTGSSAIANANHSVTIVGWDDNYSSNNFVKKPAGNGAWLIANSYGVESGDDGYFWLSYYDQSICDCSSFLVEPSNNYGHIYQYDGFGWGTATYSDSINIKAANIFKAEDTSPQQLQAVSFYTLTDNQPYQIQVYRGVTSAPTDGLLIDSCTTIGTAEQNGYHTVPLQNPVNIAAGEKFSVVVTYIQSDSSTVYVPAEGHVFVDSSMAIGYRSKAGQSFLYTKVNSKAGSSRIQWIDTHAVNYNNVCVKAFTNDTDQAAEPLPDIDRTVKLGKGESYQISGDFSSYVSNDEALASVSSTGRVTTKKVGTTSILASRDDGERILIRFKIMKAPSKVTLKPSKKKTLKKGKHLKLKVKLPLGSASSKITFRSTRPRVAKVTRTGRITAKRPGKATIVVRTYNGRKAKLRITVIKKNK